MKETPRLKTRVEWNQEEDPGFTFTEPSMVEPVHNLSLEEILRDYSRGIVHTFNRTPYYDDGDDVPDDEIVDLDDFGDFLPDEPVATPDLPEDPEPDPKPAPEPLPGSEPEE